MKKMIRFLFKVLKKKFTEPITYNGNRTSPRLSIIIPYYNQQKTLPRLLDSIVARKYANTEILIVDDCSEEPCVKIVDAYKRRGLSISLLCHETRKFTKDARLTGIEAAKGQWVTFIDADDIFTGKQGALEKLVNYIEEQQADILHFYSYQTGADLKGKRYYNFANPYAELLIGLENFQVSMCGRAQESLGHNIWGKIYSKDLWLKILPIAKNIAIHRYREDFFLYALLVFHCAKYISSSEALYIHTVTADAFRHHKKGLGRAITTINMKKHLVPYFQKLSCPSEMLKNFEHHLDEETEISLRMYCSFFQGLSPSETDHEFERLLSDDSAENYLKLLIGTYPVENK